MLSCTAGDSCVIGGWYPPTEGCMAQCGPAFSVANPHICSGPSLGKLSGGNRMARGALGRLRPRGVPGLGAGPRPLPDHVNILITSSEVGCD